MKTSPAVAKSYAKAIFELARERQQAELIETELQRIASLVAGDAELAAVLSRPWVTPAARQRIAAEIGQQLELSKLGRDFLALAAAQGRADHLGAIAEAYRALLDAERGRVRARVRAAIALTASERTSLAGRLGRALGSRMDEAKPPGAPARDRPVEIVIDEVVDTNLLGGFVAEIGSLLVDGSLDGQLARLRERLARG
ncbi:MAG TPA: ATP synthase F1 subunit delta [Methylomirabilota bacterium]|nr:ATP synthase F1 subunit delta [Methylomirabilota bacterium]